MLVVDTNYYFDDEKDSYSEYDIVKSSPNIIDLLEEGDIVEIQNKLDGAKTIFDLNKYTIDIYKEQIKNESIKILSILTKEQFKKMEYKINE